MSMYLTRLAVGTIVTSLMTSAAYSSESVAMQVDPSQSSAVLSSTIVFQMDGTIIGDYDEVTNPEGTLTRPGVIGGSGNQPIDSSIVPTIDGLIDSAPTGSMNVEIDLDFSSLVITGMELDLLGGSIGNMDLSVVLEFVTFRTFNPTSLFIGGFSIPIPLGGATLTKAQFTQADVPGVGLLTETGIGQYDVAIAVPGELAIDVGFLEQEINAPGVPFVLLLSGTLELSIDEAFLSFPIEQSFNESLPLGDVFPVIENIPLQLPTLLPPGNIASLLFSAQPMELSVAFSIISTISAAGEYGTPDVCPEDINGDGSINLDDFSEFLVNFGATGENAADINGDLVVNLDDFSLFLVAFGTSCEDNRSREVSPSKPERSRQQRGDVRRTR